MLNVGEKFYRVDFFNKKLQTVEIVKVEQLSSDVCAYSAIAVAENEEPEKIVFAWNNDLYPGSSTTSSWLFKTQDDVKSHIVQKEIDLTKEIETYRKVRELLFP